MHVPSTMPTIEPTAGQTATVGSASALTLPAVDGANHLLGYVQTGIIHTGQWPAGAEGTARIYTRRHPDCDYLMCWVLLSAPTGNPSTFSIRAGTGAVQTHTVVAAEQTCIAVPWGAADSGWLTVTYTSTGCDILAIAIFGLVRQTLAASTDLAADRADPGHAMAGLDEGCYIVHDNHGYNVDGLALAVKEAWQHNLRHAVTWSCIEGSLSVAPGAGTPANPFGFKFKHRARWLKAAHTYRLYRVQARTWEVGAGTYTWSVTATNTTTTPALAGTAGAPDEAVRTDLQMACQVDDEPYFEMTPSGGQTLHVSDLSIVEYLA